LDAGISGLGVRGAAAATLGSSPCLCAATGAGIASASDNVGRRFRAASAAATSAFSETIGAGLGVDRTGPALGSSAAIGCFGVTTGTAAASASDNVGRRFRAASAAATSTFSGTPAAGFGGSSSSTIAWRAEADCSSSSTVISASSSKPCTAASAAGPGGTLSNSIGCLRDPESVADGCGTASSNSAGCLAPLPLVAWAFGKIDAGRDLRCSSCAACGSTRINTSVRDGSRLNTVFAIATARAMNPDFA
jgi:hypothetical protein